MGPRGASYQCSRAPEKFKTLLEGLLREISEERWTAIKSVDSLREHAQANFGIYKNTAGSRKRPAATMDDTCSGHFDKDDGKNSRGHYPTLTLGYGALGPTALES